MQLSRIQMDSANMSIATGYTTSCCTEDTMGEAGYENSQSLYLHSALF